MSPSHHSTPGSSSSRSAIPALVTRPGFWLFIAVVVVLLVLDFIYGSLTRPLLLGQGSVVVATKPAGATVIADTAELGITPLTNGKLLPGRYVLRTEHPYYEPVREVIEIARGERVERNYDLVPATGSLALVSNPRGASIRLNGELQEQLTPVTLDDLVAGVYEVELSISGRKSSKQQVELTRDALTEVSAELERVPMGALELSLVPTDTKVELVGVSQDYAPGIRLPLDTYRLRLSRTGYATQEHSIRLRRGTNAYEFSLVARMGELQLSVGPNAAEVNVRAQGASQRLSGGTNKTLTLPAGTVRVSARHPGYRTEHRSVTLDEGGASLEIDLKPYRVTVGRQFRDELGSGGTGPELVVLGAEEFRMGDLSGTGARDERPARNVRIYAPFAIGVREVTRREWMRQFSGRDAGSSSEDRLPQTSVSHKEIMSYLKWLSGETGKSYRLPSEAEWEYAARGGTQYKYGVADKLSEVCKYGNIADATFKTKFADWAVAPCDDGYLRFAPAGSFTPSKFGLYDIVGNASEWLADCWHDSYRGAPVDGSAWGRRCNAWVARGASWDTGTDSLRVSYRSRVKEKDSELGFRVVREL